MLCFIFPAAAADLLPPPCAALAGGAGASPARFAGAVEAGFGEIDGEGD